MTLKPVELRLQGQQDRPIQTTKYSYLKYKILFDRPKIEDLVHIFTPVKD